MGGIRHLWAVLAVVAVVGVYVEAGGFSGIPGNYCRNRRPSECCEDRYDDCSVPIRGTYCYCDEFCLEGNPVMNDCCPDFMDVCMRGKPKPFPRPPAEIGDDPANLELRTCDVGGVKIPYAGKKKINCNECKCEGPEAECEKDQCMIDDNIVIQINQGTKNYGWRATNYTQFWGRKAQEGLLLRTGTSISEQLARMHPVMLRPDPQKIPRRFDVREMWSGRITGVRDQGWCGSSWVFSTLGVAQDRLNILAKGIYPVALSAQNLLSCAKVGQEGCRGGRIDRAWNYLRRIGIMMEECYPYESGWSSKAPHCDLKKNPLGSEDCKNLYKYEPSYRLSSREQDIQWEIMTNGPVQAVMTVYPDLFLYQTGVYTHTNFGGSASSTHSVKLMGWGEARIMGEGIVKYWVAENSWGSKWGERGYFKIRRGVNECGIESLVLAVRARLALGTYGRM